MSSGSHLSSISARSNQTGYLQQSEEKAEPPPEQLLEVKPSADGQGLSDFTTGADPTSGVVQPPQDLNTFFQAIQNQHIQLQSAMGDEIRKLQAELSAVKMQQSSSSTTLATPATAPTQFTALSAEDLSVQFNQNAGNNNSSPGSVPGSTQPLLSTSAASSTSSHETLSFCYITA